jgi:hypothetical protein
MAELTLPGRTTRVASMPAAPDEDRVVLRLAREALRANPPRVRFIGKTGAVAPQGALPWPAYD